jgi:hypothetical protein
MLVFIDTNIFDLKNRENTYEDMIHMITVIEFYYFMILKNEHLFT